MTDKQLFEQLLQGKFLRKRACRDARFAFVLYEGNMNPSGQVTRKAWLRIRDLLKEDKKGNITLNLTEVRKLNGKSNAKKLYKQFKNQNDGIRSNKSD